MKTEILQKLFFRNGNEFHYIDYWLRGSSRRKDKDGFKRCSKITMGWKYYFDNGYCFVCRPNLIGFKI